VTKLANAKNFVCRRGPWRNFSLAVVVSKYGKYLWVLGGSGECTCVNHQRTNHPVARYIHYSKGSIRRKLMLQIVVYRGDVSGKRGDRGLLTQGGTFIGVDC
jgi:hypothetical protein